MSGKNHKSFEKRLEMRSLRSYRDPEDLCLEKIDGLLPDYERMSRIGQIDFLVHAIFKDIVGAETKGGGPIFWGNIGILYFMQGSASAGQAYKSPVIAVSEFNDATRWQTLVGVTNSARMITLPGFIHQVAYYDERLTSLMIASSKKLAEQGNVHMDFRLAARKRYSDYPAAGYAGQTVIN